MAARFPPPPESAFSVTSRRTKRARADSREYLDFIRGLPCLITNTYGGIQAAHVNYADPRYGKLGRGKSQKDDDCWAVPLGTLPHEEQHQTGDERQWWAHHGIDPVPIALALWRCWQIDDRWTALEIIERAAHPEDFA